MKLVYFLCGFAACVPFAWAALVYQKRGFKSAFDQAHRLFEQSITKYYTDGANAMAAKMREEIEKIKRIQTSKPFEIALDNTIEHGAGKQRISIAGIQWAHAKEGKVPLLSDHDWNQPPIGFAFPFIDEGKLKAVINFQESENLDMYKNLYPSIGGAVKESHEETIDGETVLIIDNFLLAEVSLHSAPNADPAIKPLKDQLTFNS